MFLREAATRKKEINKERKVIGVSCPRDYTGSAALLYFLSLLRDSASKKSAVIKGFALYLFLFAFLFKSSVAEAAAYPCSFCRLMPSNYRKNRAICEQKGNSTDIQACVPGGGRFQINLLHCYLLTHAGANYKWFFVNTAHLAYFAIKSLNFSLLVYVSVVLSMCVCLFVRQHVNFLIPSRKQAIKFAVKLFVDLRLALN